MLSRMQRATLPDAMSIDSCDCLCVIHGEKGAQVGVQAGSRAQALSYGGLRLLQSWSL